MAAPGIGVDPGLTITIGFFHVINGLGGIHNDGSNLTLNNIEVSSNIYRGGILNFGGTLVLNNSNIRSNSTDEGIYGGGIHNYSGSTFTLNNSSVWNNSADEGGGIYNAGTMTINNSSIALNTVAGILNDKGTLTINNSTISSNSWGGIRTGGIGGLVNINNTTISSNLNPSDWGGGIYNNGDLIILNNSTVSNNMGDLGGGIYNNSSSVPNAVVNLRNSIVAGNTGLSNGTDCIGTIYSSGYNLIGNTSGCGFAAGTGDLRNIDAKLAPLGGNGGPTLTHALRSDSPAINAGSPLTPGSAAHACLTTDQRGVIRPMGSRCDIGAFEVSTANVATFTAKNESVHPGYFLCDETQLLCTNGTNRYADKAHIHTIGTYDFYATQHGRNSLDNKGMEIISTVEYCDPDRPCPYENASWLGTQVVYGSKHGYPLADDVVAHELTHGVTDYESSLFYYYQSGAINESFSDLWGEFYDQTNGQENDAAHVKWLIGEDISGSDPLRNMSNPTMSPFDDPDRMTSNKYHFTENDTGGVHTNSGINNKAVFLMVDGETFNSKTVTPIGWVKTAAIYYEVQTKLLTSGADYSDLYYALQQACSNLIGQKGITSGNCAEVKDAVDAVEMNLQPHNESNFNTDAPLCDAGITPNIIFTDDLEAGEANWTFTNGNYVRWQYDYPDPFSPYTHSGEHSLYANDDPPATTDANARLVPLSIPNNAYLHFAHAFQFESNIDGGILEYSIDGGSNWRDAGPLMDFNGYKGTISILAGNPLWGKSAFVGSSHGYISTRVNLGSLAGNTVTFRWRMGLSALGQKHNRDYPYWGWWLDDIKMYSCVHPNHNVDVNIGRTLMGSYYVPVGSSLRVGYLNDSGPVKVVGNNNNVPILAAMRVIWQEPILRTSYSEMMGLPKEQLSSEYWFPWYNNAVPTSMDQGFRIANVSTTEANTVEVWVGNTKRDTIALGAGASTRVGYNVDNGPVRIVCTTCTNTGSDKIIAALRVIWKETGLRTSYSEMMGLPKEQLSSEYWFPWYNNAVPTSMDQGFRIGNVDTASGNTVEVWVGSTKLETINLGPGGSTRVGYNVDNGPVRIYCSTCTNTGNDKIITALRMIWKEPGFRASYSEMMGLPTEALSTEYWFPWYNNASINSMDQGFRIAVP